ncbi:hypothetical protein [Aureimonas psammosilenae]|uniref:hypothetical protein n=1 Tax=Aureimonas psammosilenae TaxID=2495496 RepID=UPI001260FEFE|nr:hypothetical protein [Aureimonas psammosilenae]
MIPTPIADMVTPADRARVLASVKASADYGRDLADLAVLIFGAVLPPSIRPVFDATFADGLPDLLDDWHGLPEEEQAYLEKVAAMVFDRRLALHAAGGAYQGGRA